MPVAGCLRSRTSNGSVSHIGLLVQYSVRLRRRGVGRTSCCFAFQLNVMTKLVVWVKYIRGSDQVLALTRNESNIPEHCLTRVRTSPHRGMFHIQYAT